MLIVDGKLAIQWDDESREQAVERARAERKLSSRAHRVVRDTMERYNVFIVDGKLAIQWDDESREQAVERARAERKPEFACARASA